MRYCRSLRRTAPAAHAIALWAIVARRHRMGTATIEGLSPARTNTPGLSYDQVQQLECEREETGVTDDDSMCAVARAAVGRVAVRPRSARARIARVVSLSGVR